MDFTTSEYSGGGDSGWTMYLDQSYVSETRNDVGYGCYGFGETRAVEAQEEDLSMVSDASSGPRCNYYGYGEDCCYEENGLWFSGSSSYESTKKKEKKKSAKKERYGGNCQQFSCLDDTASSALQALSSEKQFSISVDDVSAHNALAFRQGLSESKSKEKSTLRKHLRFLQSTVSEKAVSEEKGNSMQRRNRG